MPDLWPWLALAGVGALHGLSPASGWGLAAACAAGSGSAAQARRALRPVALGHVASIAVVAWAATQGVLVDHSLARDGAAALLLASALWRAWRGAAGVPACGERSGHAGIAAWAFVMATAQGAGLMLLPALASVCLAGSPAREITASGSVVLAAAAVAVHLGAMLLTTGVLAAAACRGLARHPALSSRTVAHRIGTAALAAGGLLLAAGG